MANGLQGEAIPPLILKKKIKIAAGAHGGAWKVAYADFVTAMMAFFLLLWLLNATTEEQMMGLSDYFAPPGNAEEGQGVGEALAGMVAAAEGAMRSASSPPETSIRIPAYGSEEEGSETSSDREPDDSALEVNTADAAAEQQEQELLDEALSKLKQSIREDPLVRDLQDSIIFDVTEEGLLIQLLDYQRREMFEPGTDQLTRRAIRLLALISGIILELPNDVAIAGHTDSALQPGATKDYGNWELSGDRAAASRNWMELNGFPKERLVRVEGKADSDLLDKRNPEDERNRRISILLLRQHQATPVPIAGSDGFELPAPSALAGPAPAIDNSGLAPPPLPEN